METVIKKCTCKHEYQDKKNGQDLRVHNVSFNKSKCTCTVCGNIKNM